MTKTTFRALLHCFIFLFAIACANVDEDKCEVDKQDEDWQAIVNNGDCSAEQKGEAYLALGGFDYFKFATKEESTSTAQVLGLTKENWQDRRDNYYKKAMNIVKDRYKAGSNAEKTIFFLGSFLTLYTHVSGSLDNGEAPNTTAFDEQFTQEEISKFTNAEVGTDSTSDDGSTIVLVKQYQITVDGDHYVYDISAGTADSDIRLYNDVSADGSADTLLQPPTAPSPTDPDFATLILVYQQELQAFQAKVLKLKNPANWTALRQIGYMESMTDPFSSVGDTTQVTNFASDTLVYLDNMEQSLLTLGLDSSSDSVKDIQEFRGKLDNGANCSTLNNNPALRLLEIFAKNTQSTAISDYSNSNNLSVQDLIDLGKDASELNIETPPGVADSVTIGLKLLFKSASGSPPYIPYWKGATTGIATAMENIDNYSNEVPAKEDNKITFSEMICASDLLSTD